GNYTITWSTAFSSDEYVVVATLFQNTNGTRVAVPDRTNKNTATTAYIETPNSAWSVADPVNGSVIMIVAVGTQ
ncbi:MAG: hypothetical protein ACYS1A_16755, partial [Planctomycetota bacterium]